MDRLIFISHSVKDTWIARKIAQEVSACGAVPFLDEDAVEIGDDFEEKILTSLNQADELLVLLTPWALGRPYVWAELGVAWGRKIPIIVVLHGLSVQELQAKTDVPVFLRKRDMIDINELDDYFLQLKARVQTA